MKAWQKNPPIQKGQTSATGLALTGKKGTQLRIIKTQPAKRLKRHLMSSLNKTEEQPIIFLDSGIGSIPYVNHFRSVNNKEKIILIADRENFPYGSKSKEDLIKISLSLTEELILSYNPKIIIVACNTASVSALDALREKFPSVPFVGTVPAVKPAVLFSKKRCIGVLGTRRTVEDPYIQELNLEHGPDCSIITRASPELVDFVEHRWLTADKNEKLSAVKPWIDIFKDSGIDALVLSCTHFLLLREEFNFLAKDNLAIFDSIDGVVNRIESLLQANQSTKENINQLPSLIVRGETDSPYWEKLCSHFNYEFLGCKKSFLDPEKDA